MREHRGCAWGRLAGRRLAGLLITVDTMSYIIVDTHYIDTLTIHCHTLLLVMYDNVLFLDFWGIMLRFSKQIRCVHIDFHATISEFHTILSNYYISKRVLFALFRERSVFLR